MGKARAKKNTESQGPFIPAPVHPGEIIREEYLPDYGMTGDELARAAGIPVAAMRRVLGEESPITGEMALKLGAYFGQTPQMWMGLQATYELAVAHQRMRRRDKKAAAEPKRRKSA